MFSRILSSPLPHGLSSYRAVGVHFIFARPFSFHAGMLHRHHLNKSPHQLTCDPIIPLVPSSPHCHSDTSRRRSKTWSRCVLLRFLTSAVLIHGWCGFCPTASVRVLRYSLSCTMVARLPKRNHDFLALSRTRLASLFYVLSLMHPFLILHALQLGLTEWLKQGGHEFIVTSDKEGPKYVPFLRSSPYSPIHSLVHSPLPRSLAIPVFDPTFSLVRPLIRRFVSAPTPTRSHSLFTRRCDIMFRFPPAIHCRAASL